MISNSLRFHETKFGCCQKAEELIKMIAHGGTIFQQIGGVFDHSCEISADLLPQFGNRYVSVAKAIRS